MQWISLTNMGFWFVTQDTSASWDTHESLFNKNPQNISPTKRVEVLESTCISSVWRSCVCYLLTAIGLLSSDERNTVFRKAHLLSVYLYNIKETFTDASCPLARGVASQSGSQLWSNALISIYCGQRLYHAHRWWRKLSYVGYHWHFN